MSQTYLLAMDEPLFLRPTLETPSRTDSPNPSSHVLDALVISDLHLGSDNCQAKSIVDLLERIRDGHIATRRLIINGDVFDSIDFRRLRKTHWKVLSQIRHLSDKIEVVWIAGNHDGPAEIVSHLLGVQVCEEYIFDSAGEKILCVHGHAFDDFIEDHPILTWLADCIYWALQKIDRTHYVARLAKRKSKIFVRCIAKIEAGAIKLAQQKNCSIVLCGHTHHAAESQQHGVRYYNSGCWTEIPCTYLEVATGRVTLKEYQAAEQFDFAPASEPAILEPAEQTVIV